MAVISRFKGEQLDNKQRYNAFHAKARVKIEHDLGMLKGKFQCLNPVYFNLSASNARLRAVDIIGILVNITR